MRSYILVVYNIVVKSEDDRGHSGEFEPHHNDGGNIVSSQWVSMASHNYLQGLFDLLSFNVRMKYSF